MACNATATVLRGLRGTADVRVEQVSGLRFLDLKIDKAQAAGAACR